MKDQPRPWDVIVVGGINTDFGARALQLPGPGESKSNAVFFTGPGGKGANQAVAAARLGARVALIGAVGEDERGTSLLAGLRDERVDTTFVRQESDADTGSAVIQVDGRGRKQILAALGANQLVTAATIREVVARLERSRVVLVQLEVPAESAEVAIEWGRSTGAVTILDPAPPAPVSDGFLKLVDVIKPNAREAEALTGIEVSDRSSARRAARALLERGVGAVAIQAGDEGNLLVTRREEFFFAQLAVNSIDATGAGDAYAGTLATWLARGRPLSEAAQYANAAAAFATTALGAQGALVREADLRALLDV